MCSGVGHLPPAGEISAVRLATLLGDWRQGGSRSGAADLAAAVELQVLDGQLPLGTRLPAERQLASALGVSRTLVGAALQRLREGGFVASRRGAGSWITAPSGRAAAAAPPQRLDLIDLARASPAAGAGIMAAVDAARGRLTDELLDDGYNMCGLTVLRERIAQRYTARGLPTNPAQVMITNGAHHAFVLALRLLTGPGDRVLVEQPTYPNSIEAVRSVHARPVPVALDPHRGWDVAGIEAAIRQAAPRLAYLVADFQNPTGLRMDLSTRQHLGTVLARWRTPVVVDETLVELDLEADPLDGPPPLAAFAGEAAITVGSASKAYWGGLRLGWLRAAEDLIDRFAAARFTSDLGSPVLDQLVLAELLGDEGTLLRRRREQTRAARDTLLDALGSHCPDWTVRVPEGGLSLWCRLPEPMSTRLSVAAVNHGVRLAPASRFAVHGGLERWLRLPFAQQPRSLVEAVRRLSLAVAAVRGGRGGEGVAELAVT